MKLFAQHITLFSFWNPSFSWSCSEGEKFKVCTSPLLASHRLRRALICTAACVRVHSGEKGGAHPTLFPCNKPQHAPPFSVYQGTPVSLPSSPTASVARVRFRVGPSVQKEVLCWPCAACTRMGCDHQRRRSTRLPAQITQTNCGYESGWAGWVEGRKEPQASARLSFHPTPALPVH